MFALGHLGIAAGIFYLIHHYTKKNFDYRYVLAGAVLPDLIDKSFSLLLSGNPFIYGRFVGHTLIFAVFVLALSSKDGKFVSMSAAIFIHLLLDVPQLTGTLLWPVTSFDIYTKTEVLYNVFQYYNLAGEIIGGSILLWIAWKHKLFVAKNLSSFLITGKPLKKYRSKAMPRKWFK